MPIEPETFLVNSKQSVYALCVVLWVCSVYERCVNVVRDSRNRVREAAVLSLRRPILYLDPLVN